MKKNMQVETAQKSQTTNKNNTPTGKVKTIKSAEERRKAREEQFRNFRIGALRRRCTRMKMSKEDIEKYVKKLIEQMDAPKQYSILIMLNSKYMAMMKESMAKANITYNYCSDSHVFISGDQNVLAKLREIAPPSTKIYPYAKKMESVLPKQGKKVVNKPTSNTAESKKEAKAERKALNLRRGMHKKGKGKSVASAIKRKKLSELKKQRKTTIIQMKGKNASTGSKKPSTSTKNAA